MKVMLEAIIGMMISNLGLVLVTLLLLVRAARHLVLLDPPKVIGAIVRHLLLRDIISGLWKITSGRAAV